MKMEVKTDSKTKADAIIAWLRHYAEHFLNPTLSDERRALPPYIFMDFGNKGLFGLTVPEDYAGQGLDLFDYYRVLMQLGSIDASLALAVVIHTENAIGPLLRSGKEKIKNNLLPLMATGRFLGAVGLTEPAFGTNFFEMKTTGIREGKEWTINGIKRWNSANWANVINVFAMGKDTSTNERGVTGFTLLKNMPGVLNGPEALTLGFRSVMQNALILENVKVDDDFVLGEPFKGFEIIEEMLFQARFSTCFIIIGTMKRAMQLVHRFITRRKAMVGTLADNPYLIELLDHSLSIITTIEFFATDMAHKFKIQDPVPPVMSMLLKVAASEFGIKLVKQCMQLAGGRGYMENNHLSRMYKDVLASYYGEGANDSLLSLSGFDILYKNHYFDYLEKHFDLDAIYEEFKHCITLIKKSGPSKMFTQYISPHIAKVAMFILLYYAAKKNLAFQENPKNLRALLWARDKAVHQMHRFKNENNAKSNFTDPSEISAILEDYKSSIGDIDFQMKGEETARDDLLKKQEPKDGYG